MKRQQEMLPTSFFAKNLIFLMEEFGITQQRLADELGVSQTAISKYLKGRVPRAETLLELANYFPDVQVADLLYKDLSMGKAAGRIVQKKRRNCALLMERVSPWQRVGEETSTPCLIGAQKNAWLACPRSLASSSFDLVRDPGAAVS